VEKPDGEKDNFHSNNYEEVGDKIYQRVGKNSTTPLPLPTKTKKKSDSKLSFAKKGKKTGYKVTK